MHKLYIINSEKAHHLKHERYIILEHKKRVPVSKTKRKEFINLCSQ
ncbi:hypothetical protein [Polaribacter sp. NJDZ03]